MAAKKKDKSILVAALEWFQGWWPFVAVLLVVLWIAAGITPWFAEFSEPWWQFYNATAADVFWLAKLAWTVGLSILGIWLFLKIWSSLLATRWRNIIIAPFVLVATAWAINLAGNEVPSEYGDHREVAFHWLYSLGGYWSLVGLVVLSALVVRAQSARWPGVVRVIQAMLERGAFGFIVKPIIVLGLAWILRAIVVPVFMIGVMMFQTTRHYAPSIQEYVNGAFAWFQSLAKLWLAGGLLALATQFALEKEVLSGGERVSLNALLNKHWKSLCAAGIRGYVRILALILTATAVLVLRYDLPFANDDQPYCEWFASGMVIVETMLLIVGSVTVWLELREKK